MSTLRTRVLRLAHSNPALRPHLLPLLRAAASTEDFKVGDKVYWGGGPVPDKGVVEKVTGSTVFVQTKDGQTLRFVRTEGPDAFGNTVPMYVLRRGRMSLTLFKGR